jgi:hypothetical protein
MIHKKNINVNTTTRIFLHEWRFAITKFYMYTVKTITPRTNSMNKSIKKKIEKLLQLAMSNNPHEAELAAQRAVELMQKHSLQREDILIGEVISRTFEIEYARIPVWIRKLYNGLAYINGCYMVWIDGYRDSYGYSLEKKAKIILTGRECEVLNTEYFLQVFIREIEKKAKQHSQFLGKRRNKRTELQAYRIGLGKGLIDKWQPQ